MGIFSKLFKKKEKLTQEQIDAIDAKIEETKKKYSRQK